MYKLVIIDLDGTLLNDEQQVTERTRHAIAAILDQGIQVVFASGRAPKGILRVIELLGLDYLFNYVICFNGGIVQNRRSQEHISKNILKGKDLQEIYNWARQYQGYCYAFDPSCIVTNEQNEYAALEAAKNSLPVVRKDLQSVSFEEDIYKIIIADRKISLDKLETEIPVGFHHKYSIVRSHDNNLEFLNPFANKAEALQVLANHLGISLGEVIAIGDAGNDIGMIKLAGKGIAMGNAFHNVKEAADYITDTNNKDGVGKALEKFILGYPTLE